MDFMQSNPHISKEERLAPPAQVIMPGAHLGLQWSEFTAKDIDQAYALSQRAENMEQSIMLRPDRATFAYLCKEVEDNPQAARAIVGKNPQGEINALAAVHLLLPPSNVLTAEISGWVAPQWSRRGIGRALLGWQDAQARELMNQQDWDGAMRIGSYVCSHSAGRRCLLTAAGFTPLREFQVMLREFDQEKRTEYLNPAAIAARLPAGYKLVTWNEQLAEQVRDCHINAFASHWGQNNFSSMAMAYILRDIDPSCSPVILAPDGTVAAYLYTRKWRNSALALQSYPGTPVRDLAYSEFLGVRADQRGKGLASLCLDAAAQAARAAGIPAIGLDVDIEHASNAHAMYEKLGYQDANVQQIFYGIDL